MFETEVDDGLAVPLNNALFDGAFDGPGTIFLDDNRLSTERGFVVLDRPGTPEFALVVELLILGVLLDSLRLFWRWPDHEINSTSNISLIIWSASRSCWDPNLD